MILKALMFFFSYSLAFSVLYTPFGFKETIDSIRALEIPQLLTALKYLRKMDKLYLTLGIIIVKICQVALR